MQLVRARNYRKLQLQSILLPIKSNLTTKQSSRRATRMEWNQEHVCVLVAGLSTTTDRQYVNGSAVWFEVEVVFMHSFAGANVADVDETTCNDHRQYCASNWANEFTISFYALLAVAMPIRIPTLHEPTTEWQHKTTKSDGIIVSVRTWFLFRSSRPTRSKKPASVKKD